MQINQIVIRTNDLYNSTNKLLAKYDRNLHNPYFGYGNPFLDDSETVNHCFKSFIHSVNKILVSSNLNHKNESSELISNSLYYLHDLAIDIRSKLKKEKSQDDCNLDIQLKRQEGIKILKRWYKNFSSIANQIIYLLEIQGFNKSQITKNLQQRAKFLGFNHSA